MWPDLAERRREPEWMDDPSLPAAEHDAALRGLARLNRVARSSWILWPRLERLARRANSAGRALQVLDVATGSGDLPLAMAARARRRRLDIGWTLCDISAHALAHARARAAAIGVAVTTVTLDAVVDPLPATDVATCSLFVHHLDPPQVVALLGAMRRAARCAVGIADLDRSRLGFSLAWLASRSLTRSPIVHADALLSVRAAFTADELTGFADAASLHGAAIDSAWPARWRLWWDAP
jgi:SAM-dependent methyltransferase